MKNNPTEAAGGFTRVANALLDDVMPRVSPCAFKVLMCIARCTIGYEKATDGLSYRQVMARTGIKSRSTVYNALKDLKAAGYISNSSIPGHPSLYSLKGRFWVPRGGSKSERSPIPKIEHPTSQGIPEIEHHPYQKSNGQQTSLTDNSSALASSRSNSRQLLKHWVFEDWRAIFGKKVTGKPPPPENREAIIREVEARGREWWKARLAYWQQHPWSPWNFRGMLHTDWQPGGADEAYRRGDDRTGVPDWARGYFDGQRPDAARS